MVFTFTGCGGSDHEGGIDGDEELFPRNKSRSLEGKLSGQKLS